MPRRKPSEAVELIVKSTSRLDKTELAQELLDQFGGVKGYAKEYKAEYDATAGVMKTKLLEGVLRIITAATSKEAGDDTGAMSEADLLEAAEEIFGKDDQEETPAA